MVLRWYGPATSGVLFGTSVSIAIHCAERFRDFMGIDSALLLDFRFRMTKHRCGVVIHRQRVKLLCQRFQSRAIARTSRVQICHLHSAPECRRTHHRHSLTAQYPDPVFQRFSRGEWAAPVPISAHKRPISGHSRLLVTMRLALGQTSGSIWESWAPRSQAPIQDAGLARLAP